MDKLAKLLSYKINQLSNHSDQEEVKRSTHQRALTAQEVRSAFTNCQRNDLYDGCVEESAVRFSLLN